MKSPKRKRTDPEEVLSASQKVEAYIKQAIFHGLLKPKERILETELARKLGCSRAPVREAVFRLVREGILDTLPRRGAFVRDFTPEATRELFQMRAKLEGLCVRYMREREPEKAPVMLKECLRMLAEAVDAGDFERVLEEDMMLHRTIWKLSRCEEIYRTLSLIMAPYILMVARSTSQAVPLKQVLAHHRDYVDTILNCPIGEVESKVEDYFLKVYEKLFQNRDRTFEWREDGGIWFLPDPVID